MKNNKKQKFILLAIFVLLPLFTLNTKEVGVAANSAQRYFYGKTTSGVFVSEENSPLVVTNEKLTFDITGFPLVLGEEGEGFLNTVTAEYTIHNPSDYIVTSGLVFPFTTQPDYLDEEAYTKTLEAYKVKVDGEEIETNIRHNYMTGSWTKFDLEKNMARLRDTIQEDGVLNDLTTIYQYTFQFVSSIYGNYYRISFTFPKSYDGKILFTKFPNFEETSTQLKATLSLYGNAQFSIYLLGPDIPNIEAYMSPITTSNGKAVEEGVRLHFVDRSTLTAQEFVDTHFISEDSHISAVDRYNAVIDSLKELSVPSGKLGVYIGTDISRHLLVWYEYEIELQPGQVITNTVKAPMFPSIDAGYDPNVYDYVYLVTPASTWEDFGDLEIIIHSPYYLLDSSYGEFEKIEDGYRLKFTSLPNEDLTFRMSQSENPIAPKLNLTWIVWILVAILLGFVALVIPIVAITVTVVVLRQRKNKLNNKQ